jgi:hypothetical protein
MLKPEHVAAEFDRILTTLKHARDQYERHIPAAQTARQ